MKRYQQLPRRVWPSPSSVMSIHMSFHRGAEVRRNSSHVDRQVGGPRGFTLFELMITMAIISILATIALPKLNLNQFRIEAGVRITQLPVTSERVQQAIAAAENDVPHLNGHRNGHVNGVSDPLDSGEPQLAR